jgi:tRNA U34 2-thiouridine synthase MnmA/TrmU
MTCLVEWILNKDEYEILTDEPAWAPAPGQPAVLYSGNRLVGGGIIS